MEHHLIDVVYAPVVAVRIGHFEGTTVTIRIWHVCYAGHKWKKMSSLNRFARCDRQGADGSSVKGADEPDETWSSSVPLRNFYCSFNCFSAAVSEVDFLFEVSRADFAEVLREIHAFAVIEVGVGVM